MNVAAAVRSESPSTAVVETVAAREGVDPMDIDAPLYEAVDPDALDSIVRTVDGEPNHAPLEVEFTYYGYEVVVATDGSVRVSEGRGR